MVDMNDKNKEYIEEIKNKKKVTTFSKRWVSILLTVSIIWVTLSYVLAFLGKTEIAEQLSSQVVVVIISVTMGYLLKSYFETYSEKKNELRNKELDLSTISSEITSSLNEKVNERRSMMANMVDIGTETDIVNDEMTDIIDNTVNENDENII